MNLLVLDPMFKTAVGITRLVGTRCLNVPQPEKLLRAFRRGDPYLGKYDSFEILKCVASTFKELRFMLSLLDSSPHRHHRVRHMLYSQSSLDSSLQWATTAGLARIFGRTGCGQPIITHSPKRDAQLERKSRFG